MLLQDKTIVVVGGAGLLGQAFCTAIAAQGATTVIADLDAVRAAEAVERIGVTQPVGRLVSETVDFTSKESLQALIRRSSRSPESTKLTSGDVTVDLVAREVTRAGELVTLHPREFSLLAFLLRHAGRPVSKTMILENVWDYSFDPQTNVVDVLVSRLRSKIDPDKRRIETLRGVGYVFKTTL